MSLKEFGSNHFAAMAAIIQHPVFAKLCKDVELLGDSPDLAIGYNESYGNIYIGFNNDVALLIQECIYDGGYKPDDVKIVWSSPLVDNEFFNACDLKEYIQTRSAEASELAEDKGEGDIDVEEIRSEISSAKSALPYFEEFEEHQTKTTSEGDNV